jgi:hypothetical protein
MSRSYLIVGFLILVLAMSARSQNPALEERIRNVLLQEDNGPGDNAPTIAELPGILRGFGNDNEIVAVLEHFTRQYKHPADRSPELLLLEGAVAVLGELRANSGNDLLVSLLTDRQVPSGARARAARSLGQIDAEKNKRTLLMLLDDPSELDQIRVYAAEALAKTSDPEVLTVLDRLGREESDSFYRQKFKNAADTLREKGVKPN